MEKIGYIQFKGEGVLDLIKQNMLFFDKLILSITADSFTNTTRITEEDASHIQYLKDKELFSYDFELSENEKVTQIINNTIGKINEVLFLPCKEKGLSNQEYIYYSLNILMPFLKAMVLKMVLKKNVIPIYLNDFSIQSKMPTKKEEVISIILKNFPTLGDDVSLEQILDFKQDQELKTARLELDNWVNEVVSEKLNPTEIQEKIEYLLHKYEKQIEKHKLELKNQNLEIVTSTFGTLENLLKLNTTKIADPVANFRKRKILDLDFMENSPYREIAYIYHAKEKFNLDQF